MVLAPEVSNLTQAIEYLGGLTQLPQFLKARLRQLPLSCDKRAATSVQKFVGVVCVHRNR